MIKKKTSVAADAGAPASVAPPASGADAKLKAPYKVGYGKPPLETQFKPKQSGNPKGRPKRPPTIDEIFAHELRKVVTVNVSGKPVKMTQAAVVVMTTMRKAMTGDLPAAKVVLAGWQGLPPEIEGKIMVSKHDLKLLQEMFADEVDAAGDGHDDT